LSRGLNTILGDGLRSGEDTGDDIVIFDNGFRSEIEGGTIHIGTEVTGANARNNFVLRIIHIVGIIKVTHFIIVGTNWN
jgi:hypothetical protein